MEDVVQCDQQSRYRKFSMLSHTEEVHTSISHSLYLLPHFNPLCFVITFIIHSIFFKIESLLRLIPIICNVLQ